MITIQYFAILRDQAKKTHEELNEEFSNPSALYSFLKEKYSFTLSQSQLQLAINDEFVPWDSLLRTGDHIVFIPPVAGG